MDPTSSNQNERLPFDVLGDIFMFYAQQETIDCPIETLLLVCKSWHTAALGHRALWGQFRIHIGHRPPTHQLLVGVMRRLERSGGTVPLDIELRDLLGRCASPFMEDFEYQEVDQSSSLICPPKIDTETGRNLPCDCAMAAYARAYPSPYRRTW